MKYFLSCILAPIRRVFLKHHSCHCFGKPERVVGLVISVNDKGHFTWRTKYTWGCTLASIPGILQQFDSCNSLYVPYIRCEFAIGQQWKGKLNIPSFSSRNFIGAPYLALFMNAQKTVCDCSIIKWIFTSKTNILGCIRLPLQESFWNFLRRHFVLQVKSLSFWTDRVNRWQPK